MRRATRNYGVDVCRCDNGPRHGTYAAGAPCCCERCGFMTQDQLDWIRAEALAPIEALHVRREANIYDESECAEGDCGHVIGTCIVVATAVCAHCADQTEPGGDWEHMIRPSAYWPCATIRAALPAPEPTP